MIRQKIKDKVKDKIQRKMKDKIKDKERDSIDFGRSKVEPLFHSIFYPTLLSMVFASLFTVADGIFVGQGVGSDALAAINIVAPLFLMTTGIALMFGVGNAFDCVVSGAAYAYFLRKYGYNLLRVE